MRNRCFPSGALAGALTLALTIVALGVLTMGCGDDGSTPDGSTVKDGQGGNDRTIIQPDGQNCAQPKQYWPDSDNDGWGSALAQPVTACSPPAGHIDNPADCADEDPDAHPGQTTFFDREIKGATANKWDFNCDGQVETEFTAGAKTCNGLGLQLCRQTIIEPNTWWGTTEPACGEKRKVLTACSSNGQALGHVCSPVTGAEKTQRCR